MNMNTPFARRALCIFSVALGVWQFSTAIAADSVPAMDTIDQKIARAHTRGDHAELAAWYAQEARQALDKATEHRRMLEAYDVSPGSYYAKAKPHGGPVDRICRGLIRQYEQLATSYTSLSKLHGELADRAPEQ